MNNMRRGFTMIELIFVIVIIGILAAVAIPKLAANKDDATAATCQHEVGQLTTEISQAYAAAPDFATWRTYTIDQNVTNITVGVAAGNGITNAAGTVVDGSTITYMCDSNNIATFSAALNPTSNKYELTVAIPAGQSSPASIKAAADLTAKLNGTTKVYSL